jgi:hypothetical protein
MIAAEIVDLREIEPFIYRWPSALRTSRVAGHIDAA